MTIHEVPEVTTVRQGAKYLEFMSEAALRWKLFKDEEFRKRCARKIGRRVYVLPREIIAFVRNAGGVNEKQAL